MAWLKRGFVMLRNECPIVRGKKIENLDYLRKGKDDLGIKCGIDENGGCLWKEGMIDDT